MKDGYYLSAYLEINEASNVLSIGIRHDNCVALWEKKNSNIKLIRYWELERLTGYKQNAFACYDKEHCQQILSSLLEKEGLTLDDVIEIWGVPELLADDSYLSKHKYPEYTYHCMSHLSSCIFMDTEIYRKENVLGFNLDAGSDCIVNAYNKKGEKGEIEKYPFVAAFSKAGTKDLSLSPVFSPGIFWEHVSTYFNMREGSLMALAAASESKAYLEVDNILVNKALPLDKSNQAENQLLSLVREIESYTQEDAGVRFNYFDKRFSERENKISMVMKIIQNMSYRIMELNIENAIRDFHIVPKETYLAMSGGFALNCPCNTYLMDKYHFKGFLAPPCVSDSGMALGIGLNAFNCKTDGEFNFKLESAYYGESDSLEKFLDNNEFEHFIHSIDPFNVEQGAMDLIKEPIIWFDGHSEIGPRALGGRSILGDPRKQETKDILNIIKKRQWWRPVAPIVLKEHVKDWFENNYESPYMLHTLKIKEERINEVIAIAHSNGTARLQTIDKDTKQSRLHQLMEEYHRITGVPIICNTSLNDKGEPIINQIDEAFNFALRKNINIIYVNGHRIQLKNHENYVESKPLRRKLNIGIWKNEEEYQELYHKYNPHNIDDKLFMTGIMWGLPYDRLMDGDNKLDALQRVIEIKMYISKVGILRRKKIDMLYNFFSQMKNKELIFNEEKECV